MRCADPAGASSPRRSCDRSDAQARAAGRCVMRAERERWGCSQTSQSEAASKDTRPFDAHTVERMVRERQANVKRKCWEAAPDTLRRVSIAVSASIDTQGRVVDPQAQLVDFDGSADVAAASLAASPRKSRAGTSPTLKSRLLSRSRSTSSGNESVEGVAVAVAFTSFGPPGPSVLYLMTVKLLRSGAAAFLLSLASLVVGHDGVREEADDEGPSRGNAGRPVRLPAEPRGPDDRRARMCPIRTATTSPSARCAGTVTFNDRYTCRSTSDRAARACGFQRIRRRRSRPTRSRRSRAPDHARGDDRVVPYHVVGKADVTATRSLKVESDDYSVDERGEIARQVIEQSIAALGIPFIR